MLDKLEELKKKFAEHGQEHVFAWADKLSEEEQEQLYQHLQAVDLPYMTKSYKLAKEFAEKGKDESKDAVPPLKKKESNFFDEVKQEFKRLSVSLGGNRKSTAVERKATAPDAEETKSGKPEPLSGVLRELEEGQEVKDPERELSKAEANRLRDVAYNNVVEGKVAALLLAGGQGTRLGSANPKGMFDGLGLESKKTLFMLQAERIMRLEQLASERTGLPKATIPWYVMCSDATLQNTEDYFKSMNFFGLNQKDVFFFKQRSVPALTKDGKFILETKTTLAQAPNGNGGIYPALGESGAVADMERRGVEHVHVFGVDNILCQVADPLFMGLCIEKKAEAGCKVVAKARPSEEIGVFCANYEVIEYSELGEELANERLPNGELAFNAGNICNHYYSRSFLSKVTTAVDEDKLPYHIAKKKIPYCDDEGNTISPKEKNGIKLELFIFDVFNADVKMAFLEVPRESEFAAVKNSEWKDPKNPVEPSGLTDSPKTAREALWALHRSWLVKAGAKVEGPENASCEISPLASYGGEGLSSYSGKTVALPFELKPVQEAPEVASGVNCAGGKCAIM